MTQKVISSLLVVGPAVFYHMIPIRICDETASFGTFILNISSTTPAL